MKIYTKTGDKGTTALFGGTRVPKHHLRIESYGTIDELNSYIGLVKDQAIDENTKNVLLFVHNYDRHRIRKTSMGLGLRSEAAVLFEKGLDSENVKNGIFLDSSLH